jgi:hypothetical protein
MHLFAFTIIGLLVALCTLGMVIVIAIAAVHKLEEYGSRHALPLPPERPQGRKEHS